MRAFSDILNERVNLGDLKKAEKDLDKLFDKIGLDVNFRGHFIDRVNDTRNSPEISIPELKNIFNKTFKKYGTELSHDPENFQAILTDIQSKINIPFILRWNEKEGEMSIIPKTIMRTDDFHAFNKRVMKV